MTKSKIFNPLEKAKSGIFLGLALAVLLAVFACVLAWAWAGRSDGPHGSEAAATAPAEPLIDAERLSGKYSQQYRQILDDYLSRAQSGSSDLPPATLQAKERLLALTVPAPDRNKHLQAVLLLERMLEALRSGQAGVPELILDELKNLPD